MDQLATAIASLQRLKHGSVQQIEAIGHLDATVHQWAKAEIHALILALSARRPLLVRGEPGTGKTQLARAAAAQLGWALHAITVHPRIEASDLIYRFDAVRRLADAQAGADNLKDADYWEPGPLWKAFGWRSACEYGSCRDNRSSPAGHVVLLDEIDKADSDVPNSLLDVLGQRSFEIPQLRLRFGGPQMHQPLILITTNEERELPSAFLRRCLVLNLEPDRDKTYAQWLQMRGRAHFTKEQLPDDVLQDAAERLDEDRRHAVAAGLSPPGLAEYIDLLSALHQLAPADAGQQREWMRQLSAYAFIKHRGAEGYEGIDQQRPFDAKPADAGGQSR